MTTPSAPLALDLSATDIALGVAFTVGILFVLLLAISLIRSRRTPVHAAIAEGSPEPERAAEERKRKAPAPVSRRDFFRRSLVTSLAIFGAQFGGASIAFLWPSLRGGFGSLIDAGSVSDIKNEIQSTRQPFYSGSGRFYIATYAGKGVDPSTGVDYEAEGTVADGLIALYQRCVHLGCRVPFCEQSQWFECPCHGSKYNKAGEFTLGPAPRGLDRFPISVENDRVMVDTSTIVIGPTRGTDTIRQAPQGAFCVGA
jgi:cytochrome b6-f complex iron-sulfur subunit